MKEKICTWYRKFDGHYTMSCTNENGKRAHGLFHRYIHDEKASETRWNFIYCPYCSGRIVIHKMDES